MIRAFTWLLVTLYASTAWSGLPPTSIQGQSDASAKTKFSFQVPYNQSTDLGGIKALIETGNKNLLPNASFENTSYASGWTITTASGAVETTTIKDGKQSAKITFSASTGDIAQSVTPTVQMTNQNMESACWVNTTLSTIQVCALVGGTETNCQNVPATGTWQQVSSSFIGPSSGSVGVRVKTTASTTGSYYVDDCYVGPNRNVGTGFIATDWKSDQTFSPSAGFGTTSNANIQYRQVGDSWEVRGSFTAGTTAASIGYLQLPTGYTIDTSKFPSSAIQPVGLAYDLPSNANYNIWSNNSAYVVFYDGSTNNQLFFTPQTNVGAFAKYNGNALLSSGQPMGFYFTVPIKGLTSNQSAYLADVTPASWSGYQGPCSFSASTTSSYLDVTNGSGACTLTERQNRNFGTITPYGGTGLSAKGGITFTPPRAGRYLVCATTLATSSSATSTIALALNDTSSNFIVEQNQTVAAASQFQGYSLCGIYNASDSTSKTIRIQAKNSSASTSVGGGASPAIEWSVIELDAPMPAPYLTGSVTSTTTGQEHIERAAITNNGTTCAIASQSGSWLSGISRPGTGQCTLTVTSGEFSGAPQCSITTTSSGNVYIARTQGEPTSTSIPVVTANTSATTVDSSFDIICMGPR